MMKRRTFLVALAGLLVTRKWRPPPVVEAEALPPAPAGLPIGTMLMREDGWHVVADSALIPCDGRTLSREEFPGLYSLFQNGWGNHVPDMRARDLSAWMRGTGTQVGERPDVA